MGEKIKEKRSYYAMTTFNKLIKKMEKKNKVAGCTSLLFIFHFSMDCY